VNSRGVTPGTEQFPEDGSRDPVYGDWERDLIALFNEITTLRLQRPRLLDRIQRMEAALAAERRAALDVRSEAFRAAVKEVFEAPGEWGPAQGYYAGDIDHFIDMLAARLERKP
jgi:hypothetical protein